MPSCSRWPRAAWSRSTPRTGSRASWSTRSTERAESCPSWAGSTRWRARPRRGALRRGPRRLDGALEAVLLPGADRRAPVRASSVGGAGAPRRRRGGRDRPGRSVRNGHAPNHPDVLSSCSWRPTAGDRSATSAAARACWRSRPRRWDSNRCSVWTRTGRHWTRPCATPAPTASRWRCATSTCDGRTRRSQTPWRRTSPRGLCEAVALSWAKRGVRPGTAIVSGFLREEADGVEAALAKAGLEERRRVVGGEWAAILAS